MISQMNYFSQDPLNFRGFEKLLKLEVKVEHEFEYLAEIYRLDLQYWRRH